MYSCFRSSRKQCIVQYCILCSAAGGQEYLFAKIPLRPIGECKLALPAARPKGSFVCIRRGGVIGVVGVSHTLLTRSRGYLGTATATAASHSCHRSSVAIDLFPCMLPILSHASDVDLIRASPPYGLKCFVVENDIQFTHTNAIAYMWYV